MEKSQQTSYCQFCSGDTANYTCPRCNKVYCSVDCYRSQAHLKCSENFYKECCMKQLQEIGSSEEDKKRMLDMLLRDAESALDGPTEDLDDLGERLGDLDLETDSDLIWERLTDKEKSGFQEYLQRGIATWQPWWLRQVPQVVESSGVLYEAEPSLLNIKCQQGENVKSVRVVSTSLAHHVFAVLFSYVLITRHHNGEHHTLAVDAAQMMLQSCPVLNSKSRQEFASVSEVIQMCFNLPVQSVSNVSVGARLTLVADVLQLLSNHRRTGAALSDLHKLLCSARRTTKKEVDEHLVSLHKSCKLAEKKIEFILMWSDRNRDSIELLSRDVAVELDVLREEDRVHQTIQAKITQSRTALNKESSEKNLIEEVP